jgi:hypothetical protein
MDPQVSASESYSSSPAPRGNLIILVLGVLLVLSLIFGGWAFSGRQTYKNKSDQQVAAAVAAAKKAQAIELQNQFAEQSKQPYATFHGSPTYGSLSFNYPKTWSAYVDTTSTSEPINAYYYPSQVPGLQSKSAYALRVELVNTDYSQVQQQFSSLIKQGKITAKAYVPPKMQGVTNVVTGTYLTGQFNNQNAAQNVNMVVIKVRDKTLEIYTESSEFLNDFNNAVLSSLSFAP